MQKAFFIFCTYKWWRRGESNSCPITLPHKLLRAQTLLIILSSVRTRTN